ncbi:MAG: hypothetical protein JWL77_5181 [Chthonomonadaceae bacterium]|nr:hypothetical protein [Chthonomonadaceae bacterium]
MKQTINRPLSTQTMRTSRRPCTNRQVATQSTHAMPDAYGMFVNNTSQEAKDEFYSKLAGVLLKRTQTPSEI